jgi:hypothetical protein
MLWICVSYLRAATLQEIHLFLFWHSSPHWAMASSFTRFLDHTERRTTVGRTPLDEWLARRRDFSLTTHNTPMPPVGFFHYVLSYVTRIPRVIPYLFKQSLTFAGNVKVVQTLRGLSNGLRLVLLQFVSLFPYRTFTDEKNSSAFLDPGQKLMG